MLLLAQEGNWSDFLGSWRKGSRGSATLLIPKERLTPAYSRSDEALLLMTVTGDLSLRSIEGPLLDSLRESRGWKDASHWLLIGPDGGILDEGADLPKGDLLLGRLQAAGIPSTWDALEAFLRRHPDHGTALQHRLELATRLAWGRFENLWDQGKVSVPRVSDGWLFPVTVAASSKDSNLPGDWCQEVEDTLSRLNQLPDPWRLEDLERYRPWLNFFGNTFTFGMRSELNRLNVAILEAWKRNPHSGRDFKDFRQISVGGLGAFWMAANQPSGALPVLPQMTPSPGRFWPHSNFLMALPWPTPDGSNAQAILSFLDRLPNQETESSLWQDPWSEWLRLRAHVAFIRVMALTTQERWQEAALELQECRRMMGKDWQSFAAQLSGHIFRERAPDPSGKPEDPARTRPPEVFLEVLRLPPVANQPSPAPPAPLRFLIWGQPAWSASWEALRASAPFAPWSAAELVLEAPRASDTARLTQAGFPVRGWAVFQGDATLVARGEGAPEVTRLAMQLRSVAPSRIHLLDAFLLKHPDHLDARRDRSALVKARLPQAALESRLQEDAALTLMPLDFGPGAPWITDLEGWRTQAKKVVPELEAIMQRWPDQDDLWRAWISWSAFLPKPPSVVNYLAGLPVFGSRSAWLWGLPEQVHRSVATEFRAGHRFDLMADWFEGAWSRVASREMSADTSELTERERAIQEGYREALTALGRKADRVEVDRVWAAIQGRTKQTQRP